MIIKKPISSKTNSLEVPTMAENIAVFDCDGHIIESIPEMVPFLDPVDREVAVNPVRNRQGVFASLDDIHYPRNVQQNGRGRGATPPAGRCQQSSKRFGRRLGSLFGKVTRR